MPDVRRLGPARRVLERDMGDRTFFREVAEILADGPPPPDAIPTLAAKYGLEMGRPDWLPDLIERFDLTPPPGL